MTPHPALPRLRDRHPPQGLIFIRIFILGWDTGGAYIYPHSDRKPAKRATSCSPRRQPWVEGREEQSSSPRGATSESSLWVPVEMGPDVAPDGARFESIDRTSFPRLSPWARRRRPLRGLAPLHSNPVSQQGMWDMLSPKGEGKKSKNLSLLPRGEDVPTCRGG